MRLLVRGYIIRFWMQVWWLAIIAIVVSTVCTSYALKIYPIGSEPKKVILDISTIKGVVFVKWFTQDSFTIKGAVQKPAIFQQDTRENRQGYFLNVNRISGKFVSNITTLRHGGTNSDMDLKPLPSDFSDPWKNIDEKWKVYKNAVTNILMIPSHEGRITMIGQSLIAKKEVESIV
jgi:hypothetical protein